MSEFDRYMLSQLMMFFGFFALVLVSVYWVNSAVRLFDRLISDNQSVWVFLELSALSLPNVIRLMLPVAAFVATLYATNRMAAESELVVMQATGFSPFRMARPVLFFGLLVAVLLGALTHFLVPMARTRLNERNAEISENITSRFLTEGAFQHPTTAVTLFIGHITLEGELGDFFLSDRRKPGAETVYTAKRAYLARSAAGPKLVMLDGMAQTLRTALDGTPTLATTRFANFTYDIAGLIAAQGPRVPQIEERPTLTLLTADDQLLRETGVTRGQARFEGHDRFAKPALTVAAVLVGFAAMIGGSFSRFGLWRQIAFASGLFIFLYFLTNLADKAAAGGDGTPLIAYLPALGGLAIAAALLAFDMRTRRSAPPAPDPARGAASA